MKKAKRVKVDGEFWKYFLDPAATDGAGRAFARVIFYAPDGRQHHWDSIGRARYVSPAEAKAKVRQLQAQLRQGAAGRLVI